MNIQKILQQPIPDMRQARELKVGYREYPLLSVQGEDDPLVDIALYGIAGQSYYSRPNNATGEPLCTATPTVLLRKSIAERLALINYQLQQSEEVTELLGGHVELYIDEGLRSKDVQKRLYEQDFPDLIAKQNPELTRQEVLARRDQLIAKPGGDGETPSPHATGAAVDLKLRYRQDSLGFVPNVDVPMMLKRKSTTGVGNPDYYEHMVGFSTEDEVIQRHRRVFYWIMRGALLDEDSGFVVNPTEWWHWSYGDQMWATLTHAPHAFYTFASLN